MSILHQSISPLKAYVKCPEIANGSMTPIKIIAVSCYPNERVTFWIEGINEEWLYSYIPSHYLAFDPLYFGEMKHEPVCKSYKFLISEPIKKIVMNNQAEALFMIDFLDENELYWAVKHENRIKIKPHREFNKPKINLKKMRKIWK